VDCLLPADEGVGGRAVCFMAVAQGAAEVLRTRGQPTLVAVEVLRTRGQPTLVAVEVLRTRGQPTLVAAEVLRTRGQPTLVAAEVLRTRGQPTLVAAEVLRTRGQPWLQRRPALAACRVQGRHSGHTSGSAVRGCGAAWAHQLCLQESSGGDEGGCNPACMGKSVGTAAPAAVALAGSAGGPGTVDGAASVKLRKYQALQLRKQAVGAASISAGGVKIAALQHAHRSSSSTS
jgi:hypothetical protein